MNGIAKLVRAVPDFPQAGVIFRDITPLLAAPGALQRVITRLAEPYRKEGIDCIAAIESRGFIFGAPLALELGCGFVPVRKLGKLPRSTITREYTLEYGTNHLEMHADAIGSGDRVLIVDDVLATGGTARATIDLVESAGGNPVAAAFLLEIEELRGREYIGDIPVLTLLSF